LRYEEDDGLTIAQRAASVLRAPVARRRRKMQRVTMIEVARLAKVSPSTVSLFLRKPVAVSAEAGARIAAAIDQLGYVPNLMAGGLAAATSRVVSVIVPSVRNAFFAETVAALQDAVAPAGLQLLLGHTEYVPEREEELVRTALSWAPAAIVLTGLTHGRSTRRLLLAANVPVIEMWELGGEPIDMAVGFAHRDAGAAMTRYLLARGHRRTAFLGARMHQDQRAHQRALGYAAAMTQDGAAAPLILDHPATASAEVGGHLLAEALEREPALEAVVCSNDLIALGVLFECQRRGVPVPERLSVGGFGDLPFAASCVPPLTTVRPSGDEIGRQVARLILHRVDQGTLPPSERIVNTGFRLVERQSVRARERAPPFDRRAVESAGDTVELERL
jgi:LacI family gluconate utilization system Gnt-I transcriptional repressor